MSIFGGKKSSSTTTTQQRDLTETIEQQRQRNQSTTGKQLVSALPEELQALLGDVITNIGADIGDDSGRTSQMEEIMSLFGDRALSSGADYASLIKPRMAEARRLGERELTSLESQLAREAGGSKGNTFVTAATAEGRASLESQLAAQESELGLQARALQTQELGQALEALGISPESADISNFAQLLAVLKGSTVAQSSSETVAETESQDLERILDELIVGTSKTKSKGGGFNFGSDILGSVAKVAAAYYTGGASAAGGAAAGEII